MIEQQVTHDPAQIDLLEVTAAERFRRFHAQYPEVYQMLRRFAFEWKAAGHERCGIKMLWERVRWEVGLEGLPNSTEDFKLNNNYHSRYARLLMRREPSLAGFFETRELRS